MEFIQRLQETLIAIGPFGLGGLAFLDSAGVPTGGGPDIALILLSPGAAGPGPVVGLLAATVVGSVLGCMVLYQIGRQLGHRALDRFDPEKREQVRQKIGLYGFWAILLAVMGPPPYPTKLFVLSAGVFGMRRDLMLLAVALGRTVRYGAAAYLGYHHGTRATQLLIDHYPTIFAGVVGALAVVLIWQYRRQKRRAARSTPRP